MKRISLSKQVFLITSFAAFYSSNLIAGDVTFIPRVTVSETYTDNVTLAPAAAEEEYITQINPGFNLIMDGSRFDANVDYNMQNLIYAKNSNRNQTFHQFSGTSTTQLVRQALFFDLNASRFQQVSDPTQPTNNNNLSITSTQQDVTSASASPYWRQTFGQNLSTDVRYTHSIVKFDDPILDDSKRNAVDARFSTPSSRNGTTWAVNYNKSKTDFEFSRDAEFERYSADLGYRFSQRTHIYGQYGDEENNYASLNNSSTSGTFWNIGFNWQPAAQDRFALTYGERFFGKTTNFSWVHTGAYLRLNASYLDELATTNDTVNQTTTTGIPQAGNNLNNTNQVFVRSLGQIGINYVKSKTTLGLNFSSDRRKFQDTGAALRQETTAASVLLQATPNLRYQLAHNFIAIYDEASGFKAYENRTTFGVVTQLSQNTRLSGNIAHNTRNTNTTASEYAENNYSISLTKSFR